MQISIGKIMEDMVMRNDEDGRMARTILAVFVVWTLLLSGVIGLGASWVAVAGEEPIEANDDWNCNSAFTVTGDIELDGNLNLLAGCVLTVQDGGITFAIDNQKRHSLNINVGATLNLIDSYITVETNQIQPYLILPVTVAGTFYGENAVLQFPGFINVTGTMELWDSDVTAMTDFGGYVSNIEPYDDAPVFTFAGNSMGQFYRTSIEPYYTGTNRNDPNTGWMYDFNVTGNSRVWFVDSYLDVDFVNDVNVHNVLMVRDTSQVYAYNLSMDTSISGNRVGAVQTSGTGVLHIMRWANVLCVDNDGVPIEGVTLVPLRVQTGTRPNFPDSGTQNPHNYILSYLGETAGTWLTTGPNGKSLVPLVSEFIDDTVVQTTPNSEFYGAYEITGTYLTLTDVKTFSFNPYPAMDPADGTAKITLVFDTYVAKPDLIVTDIRWTPANPVEGDNVTFEADVQNQGATGANDVYVCFYVDGQPLNNTPTLISFVGSGATVTTPVAPDPPVYWAHATGDNHTVLVLADCLGGVSEEDESNNGLTRTLYVVPLLPDYEIIPGYISFPPNSYIGNPVMINITVGNPGSDLAPENTVRIYLGDPTLGAVPQIGEIAITSINASSTTQSSFEYTFHDPGDYKICAWVDSTNLIREESETNNMACNILRVDLAPNLKVTSNDIGVGDPCTRMGQTVTPQAIVRNVGYVNAGAYEVNFYIDGDYFASGNSTGLASDALEMISSDIPWVPTDPGIHVLSVVVDPADAVKESTNSDNVANKDILIFHNKRDAFITTTVTLPVDKTYASNIDITGSLTIDGKTLRIQQPDPLIGRYCIKVYGSGSLILKNGANLVSNYPLVIYVSDSASLIVDDADLNLDVLGVGGIFADDSATIDIKTSVLQGNIFSTGNSVSLEGVDLLGTDLYIETATTSYIWDTQFTGILNLYLLSDDGNVNTVDFDIRNVSFAAEYLDEQLVFKGNQLVELTNVELYIPEGENWHTGVITEKAKGRLYWWLTTKMVDGTGAVLASLTPEMDLDMLDGGSLIWGPVYSGINVPGGQITFRVLSEEVQYYPVWAWTNSTYAIDARVMVSGTWFYPDTQDARGNWTGDVRDNMEVELKFSGLTPDFSISQIIFVGEGMGNNQPVNRPLRIQVTVFNSGNIASSGVEVMMYLSSQIIGYDVIDVPAAGSAVAIDDEWIPSTIGPTIILVCADDNNTYKETDENNNCLSATLNIFGWPDMTIDSGDVIFATEPVEQTPGDVSATVRNMGTSNAVNAVVTFQDDEGWSDSVTLPLVVVGEAKTVTMEWTPQTAGTHSLTITVDASNLDIYQRDYDQTDNDANLSVLVLTLPDLEAILLAGWIPGQPGTIVGDIPTETFEVTVGVDYMMYFKVNNSGGSTARNVTVVLVLDNQDVVCQETDFNVTAGGSVELHISCPFISDIGTHTMSGIVDPDDVILEGREDNNVEVFTFEVIPPSAYVSISMPLDGHKIKDGTELQVEGWVREVGTDRGIVGVPLVLTLEDEDGNQIGLDYAVSAGSGRIITGFTVPDNVDCEKDYTLEVGSNETYVVSGYVQVTGEDCERPIPFWIWLLIIIIIIVVVIVVAITAYIKVFGLGKLVECGECGAFIPEDSTACPKCGVQFETETAKCSNCQAWVPLSVKKCPECGVEFATGEVEMEDYKAKMRMQYDEVKTKVKKEAERELGKSLTDREFENWWKTQPTFVTFEGWLKQEEDMRKMGSKPCPSCGTLNAVTATICHKCGAPMVEEERPRRPPSRPPEEKPAAAVPAKKEAVAPPARPGTQPPAAAPEAVKPVPKKTLPTVERPVPKKVVKKPVVEGAPTVVPKKVVRRPEDEEEEDEGY
jgi:subtilase family serine protease/ribosomal protein L40E